MSISVDLRSFKNPSDRARKFADFKEYLKLQQKLNKQSEEANKAYAKGQVLGLQPQGPSRRYASAEEAQADIATQKEEALKHLQTILPYGDDALQAVNRLDAVTPIGARGSELFVFNQSWGDFVSELKGQKNLTVPYFFRLWQRYREKIAKTKFTGIQIPIDDTEFNTNLRNLGTQTLVEMNRLYDRTSRTQINLYQMTARKQEEVREAIERAIQNRDQTRLEELNKALKDGNEKIINKLLTEIRPIQYMMGKIAPEGVDIELETAKLEEEIRKAQEKYDRAKRNAEQPNLSKYMKDRRSKIMSDALSDLEVAQERLRNFKEDYAGVPQTQPEAPPQAVDPRYDETKLKNMTVSELKYYARQFHDFPERGSVQLGSLGKKIKASTQKKQDLIQYINFKRKGGNPTQGTGMKTPTIRRGFKVVCGRGIQSPPQERYNQFGRYIIHLPSLKNNKLNLKYPSLGYIPNIPITHITDDMKEFLMDLLETERITPHLYNKLSKDDKNFFDRIAEQAKIDESLGIKIENLDRKEKMKRFSILQGELVAGNDNAELRNEFKRYLIQFMNEGIIPRKQGTNLLVELMAM